MTRCFGFVGQADLLQHLVDAGVERLAGEAVHLSPESQVLAGGEVFVEGQLLRHHADGIAHRHGFARDRVTADGGIAAGGGVEGGETEMVVVLPAPLGPSRLKISPSLMSKEMPLTAVKSPYFLTRSVTSRMDDIITPR